MPRNRIQPGYILVLWLVVVIQKLIRLVYRVEPLRNDDDNVICTKLRRYNAPPITLDDGCEIKAGDRIIELHLNNSWFIKRRKRNLTAPGLIWESFNCFERDLSFLAEQIAGGMFGSITALHGNTLLHGFARRRGFQVEELPDTWWNKITEFYIAGLMHNYYLRGRDGFKISGKPLGLKSVWLSKAALFRIYGNAHADSSRILTS